MRKLVCILFLVVVSITSIAQEQSSLDSMREVELLEEYNQVFIEGNRLNAYQKFDSALYYANQAYNIAKELKKVEYQSLSHTQIGDFYISMEEYSLGISHLDSALTLAQHSQDTQALIEAYGTLGRAYQILLDYEKAIMYFENSIQLARAINHKYLTAKNLNNLAPVFQAMGENEMLLKTYLKCISILESMKNKPSGPFPILYNNIGVTYNNMKDYSKAAIYFKKSISIGKETNTPVQPNVYYSLIQVLLHLNQLDSAEFYMLQFQKIKPTDISKYYELYGAYTKAELLFSQGRISKAIDLAKINLSKTEPDSTYTIITSNLYDLLEKASIQNKDYKSALSYKKKLSELNKIQKEKSNRKSIKHLRAQFETELDFEKQKRVIQELELKETLQIKEFDKEKKWKNFILILSTLGLLLSLLIVNRFKLSAKAATENEYQLRLEKENLSLQIEYKNRELNRTSEFVAEKNQLLLNLQEHLAKLKSVTDNDVQKEIRNIKNEIKSNINLEEDWENIKLHFDEVYPSFFQNLAKLFPDLTNLELKHSAYLKMNLSVKEVARMLSVAPKSVQMSHYRLKKKLGLTTEDNLSGFLDQIS